MEKMEEMIVTAENFRCPNCDTKFTKKDLINLCGEPFDGIIITCKKCKKKFAADIIINLREEE